MDLMNSSASEGLTNTRWLQQLKPFLFLIDPTTNVTRRLASREDLDDGNISIGVPSFIPVEKKAPDALANDGALTSNEGGDQDQVHSRPDKLYFMLLQVRAGLHGDVTRTRRSIVSFIKRGLAVDGGLRGGCCCGVIVLFHQYHMKEGGAPVPTHWG